MNANIHGDLRTLDLVNVFRDLGLYLNETNEPGKHHVKCPWEHEHY